MLGTTPPPTCDIPLSAVAFMLPFIYLGGVALRRGTGKHNVSHGRNSEYPGGGPVAILAMPRLMEPAKSWVLMWKACK